MHGPLWTADTDEVSVKLWGPNAKGRNWSIHWDLRDGDDEYLDGGFEKRDTAEEALSLVPAYATSLIEAIRPLVSEYDPDEECDHSQAHSFSIIDEHTWVCGHCGRTMPPKENR